MLKTVNNQALQELQEIATDWVANVPLTHLTPSELRMLLAILSSETPTLTSVSNTLGATNASTKKLLQQLATKYPAEDCELHILVKRILNSTNSPENNISKEVIQKYVEVYYEAYRHNYKVNWAADIVKIKTLLALDFCKETLLELVIIWVNEYSVRWKNGNFVYPTIGAFASWGYKECLRLHNQRLRVSKPVAQSMESTDSFQF
jgi:DNA-binding MarR family transcriptional regulator